MTLPAVRLKDVTTKIGSGSTPTGGDSAYKNFGVPLVRSMNIHDGAFIEKGLAYLDSAQADALKNVRLHTGDVLINITGASVARVCRLPDGLNGGRVNQHVAILRPRPDTLNAAYLEHLLRAPAAKAALLSTAGSGATREAITKAQLEEFRIPLPPLDEQRRIAAILDKADALRQKRSQFIALLASLTQSIFLDMFGSPVSNPLNFPITTLGQLDVEMVYGPRFYNESYTESGTRIVRVTDLSPTGSLSFEDMPLMSVSPKDIAQHRAQPGDVLFARSGSVGKVALIADNDPICIPGAYFIRLRFPAEVLPIFAASLLRSDPVKKIIRETAQQSAQPNFSGPSIKRLPFLLPNLDLQKVFAGKVKAAEKMLVTVQASEFGSLFASLQHRAFSGQL